MPYKRAKVVAGVFLIGRGERFNRETLQGYPCSGEGLVIWRFRPLQTRIRCADVIRYECLT